MATYDDQLFGFLVDLTVREQPLASGLRALAEDVSAERIAPQLSALAGELEQGKPLVEAIEVVRDQLPPQLPALLRAGLESGQVAVALQQFVEQQRRMSDLRYELRQALAYPVLVIALLVPVILFFSLYLVPTLDEIYTGFELELPQSTQFMIWLGKHGLQWLATLAGVAVGGLLLVRFVGGKGAWHRLLGSMPLFGPLFTYSGWAEMNRMLATLLEHGVPLPAALRHVARGIGDAHQGNLCHGLADSVEQGVSFPQALGDSPAPPTLAALATWGAQHDRLAAALAIAGDSFEERARIQTTLLRGVLPPVLFLLAAATLLFLMTASFLPLMKLVSELT